MFGLEFGILAIIALVLFVWALINVVQSTSTSPLGKAIWIVLLFVLPFLGFIIWLFFGPRSGR
jgi:hypothetical protein